MRKSLFVAVLGLSFLMSAPTWAQGVSFEVGPRIGYDLGDIEELFLGVDGRVGVPTLPVTINPTFDYYFADGFDFFQFSVNALYDITSGAMPNMSPYVGAGLGISNISLDVDTPFGSFSGDDSDIGINLIGGASVQSGGFKPFAQVQITLLGDIDLITVSVGTLFSLGG